MQKKAISLIIALSLIIGTSVPCFAVSTDSSIKSSKLLSDIKATSPSTTVEPEDSTGQYYYYNGSTVTYGNQSVTTWGHLVTGITRGFAQSISTLSGVVSSGSSNIISALNDIFTRLGTSNTYIDGIENQITGLSVQLGNIIGYIDGIESYIDGLENTTSNIKTDTGNIYNLLSNGMPISFSPYWDDLAAYFEQDGVGGFIKTVRNGSTQSYLLPRYRQSSNGGSSSDLTINFAQSGGNVLGQLFYNFSNLNTSSVYAFRDLLSGVGLQNVTDGIYENDLTFTQFGRVSLWKDFRLFATNTSYFLSRLGYVLASDEEIAARQAAAANQDAVVDDFISSSGNASATPSDFGDVASAGSNIKNALSSNVSADNAFQSLSSTSNAWDWFSQSTLDSLDSTSSQSRKLDNNTPLLDSYYSDLQKTLMVKK